jgi:hypothetical protein
VLGWLWLIAYPVLGLSYLLRMEIGMEAQLLFASVFSFVVTMGAAGIFSRSLFSSQDAVVLAHYPFSDEDFIARQVRRMAGSAAVIAITMCAIYLWHGVQQHFGLSQWLIALLLCLAHWLFSAGAAVVLVWFRPFAPWGRTAFAVCLALIVSMFTISGFPKLTMAAWQIAKFWPAHWINYAFSEGAGKGDFNALLPAAAVMLFIPVARRCLRTMSSDFETGALLLDDVITAERYSELVQCDSDPGQGGEEACLQAGLSDRVDNGNPGWIEAIVENMLSERERVLLPFLTASSSFWTSHWKLSVLFVLVGLFGPVLSPLTPAAWFSLILTVIGFARGLPVGGGIWHGLSLVQIGTMCETPLAYYPLGYWETTRLMIKVNFIRIIAWLPMFVLVPLVICWQADAPLLTGMRVSGTALYAVLGFQVFVCGFKMYDRSSARNMKPIVAILGVPMMLTGLISGVSCLAAMIMAPWWGALLAAAGYVLLGIALWGFFGFLFNNRKTDLFYPVPRK